jgi:saccharopine dehydrogenase-like NADP-dependent oxidoreductase
MQHDIEYFTLNNEKKQTTSFLKLVGKNNRETAMAATVGLPLAIAALLVLNNEIKIYGVQIPIHKDIYAPVLAELKNNGIVFEEHTTTL